MPSAEFYNTRKLAAKTKMVQVGTDGPVAIRLRYKGSGTVTSVTVTTATNIVAVTSDGGTDTYAFSTYTTIGTLADAINKDGIFEAKILDALRSDASASKLVDGAITSSTVDGVTVWDVKSDTDAIDQFALAVTFDRGFNWNSKTIKNHCAVLRQWKYLIDFGTASLAKIVERDGATETVIFSQPAVDNTETTPLDYTATNDDGLSVDGAKQLVLVCTDAGNLADASTNWLRATYRCE